MERTSLIFRLLMCVLLFHAVVSFAQMSDHQVIQEMSKYKNLGLSQDQIVLELRKKGVSTTQLMRIKELYDKQVTQATVTPGSTNNSFWERIAPEESKEPENSIVSFQPQLVNPEEQIFGQNFFSSGSLTFSPNMNMPTPGNYILGPGDELVIDVWGDSEFNARYTILPDGHITVPNLGRIQLSGLNIKEAESKIKSEFTYIFSDLESYDPRTFIAVSLGNVRTIRVNVMGEVMTPGTYTLTSFASVFHALYVSGGPNKIGSLRNIKIFRDGSAIGAVDMYEYLMKGNNTGDIMLQDGDIVKVEPYGILVQITGEVKRPMWYEMKPSETFQDLLGFSGGFAGNAYFENVFLLRKGGREKEAYTLHVSDYSTFNLKDGDQITVGNILDQFSNMVEISGAVHRPGRYAIGEDIRTIRDLVNVAQNLTGDAYTSRVLLYRQQDDLRETIQSFDLDALMQNRMPDILLQKNDRLYIPSIFSLEDNLTVYIGGEVRSPGTYPYASNMHLEDIILQAGGLKESASTAQVDVYRRVKDPSSISVGKETGEAFHFSLIDGKIVSSDPDFLLQPFDQVIIRRSPGYEVQQLVTVRGEVVFDGQYAKLRKDERLSSFVERAGGLTSFAYPKGARLLRYLGEAERKRAVDAAKARAFAQGDSTLIDQIDIDREYIGIDLEKALKKPGGSDDIILRGGDELYIPIYEGTVKISGGVLYPNTVTYKKGMNIDWYVRQAGGYSRLAMKNKPFVIYMNGKVASGPWVKVEPGSEIVVPERPERKPVSIQEVLGVTSSLATLALLITNILK